MVRCVFAMVIAISIGCLSGDLSAQEGGRGPRGERPDGRFGGPPMRGGPAPGEFMRMLPVMKALDADGDGEISAAEIENAVAALKKLDKNQDGKLTADELLPEFPGPGGPAGFGRDGFGRGGFGRGDGPRGFRGGEGFGPREGDNGPGRGTNGSEQTIARLMQFDRNQDGKLAKEEFPQRVRAIFARADADHDGFVTHDELVRLIANDAPSDRPRDDRPRDDRPRDDRPAGDRPVDDRAQRN